MSDRWTAETIEPVAREITHGWMAHLGYTPEQIAEADTEDPHTRAGCEFDSDSGWCCIDENASSLHPEYDESCEVAELVMFVLEHPALAGLLLPPGGETRQEWRVVYRDSGGFRDVEWSGPHLDRDGAEVSLEVARGVWPTAQVQSRVHGPWVAVSET